MTPATLDPKLRNGIGASEIALLFGCSPWGGPMELYMLLVHPEVKPATRDQDRGIRAEPLLAERYAGDHGLLHSPGTGLPEAGAYLWNPPTQRHEAHDFLIASADRAEIRDGKLVHLVEIKTDGSRKGWEDPEEVPDGVPLYYYLQVQQQLACGLLVNGERQYTETAKLIACIGHFRDYREYTIERSPKVEAALIERAGAFWHDHVLAKRPPDFDGSAAGEALLKLMYPADTRPVLARADETANAIAARLRDAQAQAEHFEQLADTERQLLKSLIGDGAGILGEGWKATWKRNKDGSKTDWKAVAEYLRLKAISLLDDQGNAGLAAKVWADALTAHTTTTPGARPLRVTFKDPAP